MKYALKKKCISGIQKHARGKSQEEWGDGTDARARVCVVDRLNNKREGAHCMDRVKL